VVRDGVVALVVAVVVLQAVGTAASHGVVGAPDGDALGDVAGSVADQEGTPTPNGTENGTTEATASTTGPTDGTSVTTTPAATATPDEQSSASSPPAGPSSPPSDQQGGGGSPAAQRVDQNFSIDDVGSSLDVGGDGTVSGTITNDGPEDVENAVLVVATNASDVAPRQSEVVLGDIEEGESVVFEYPVSVRSGVPPGDRQVSFVVQFETEDGVRGRSAPLAAQVTVEEPDDDLTVTAVESDLEPGERGTVAVTVENAGEDAEDAVLSLQSLSSAVLFGESPNTSVFVGDWAEGEERTVEVSAVAGDPLSPGDYPVRASLSYTDADNEPGRAGPVTFGVGVGEATDAFELVATDASVPVGEEGTVGVTLRNTGDDASEATVSLSSLGSDLRVGPRGNATAFVGDWPEGEERTVEFQVTAANDSERREYPLRTSVAYTDDDGDAARSEPSTFGVEPLGEQAFALSNVSANLSVGDEGVVTGTVTNEGPGDAENAVVTLVLDDENVNAQERQFAVGSLPAGESANVSFSVEVASSAEPGLRQLSFAVEYDDAGGTQRTSDRLAAQVEVNPERDEFIVVRRTGVLDTGGTETVTVELTNNRDGTVRNVNAQAFVDDPLSLDRDEAFVAELEPGESTNLTFEVSASGDAADGTYPLSLDFQYDTAAGESKLSEPYEVPIEVREPEDGGLFSGLFATLAVVLAVVLVGVGVAMTVRRRRGDDVDGDQDGDATDRDGGNAGGGDTDGER